MKKSTNIIAFFVLVAVLALAGIAAMPSALDQPAAPVAVATANAGELHVSWNTTSGAEFYTVGWANIDEVREMTGAGRNWLDAFHYATVPSSYTNHVITGIKPETEYGVTIGVRTQRYGGEIAWSPWTFATTSGFHGAGFCPITGVEIPPGGYLNVGETFTWANSTLKLDSATKPASVQLDDGSNYTPGPVRQLLRLCTTQANRTGGDIYFETGTHNNVSTDRGIGFAKVTGWSDTPIADGSTASACDTWSVPEAATLAVYAIDDGSRSNVLFRIELASIPTTTSTTPSTDTSVDATAITQRHIEQKEYMLQLINNERANAGVGSVALGNNVAAQLQAQSAFDNCFLSHWGIDGLKPYMRYSLAGGYQSNGENASGLSYCITAADGYAPISSISQKIKEAMAGLMDSPGHRATLLDPWHKKVNLGIVWDRYNSFMYQQFEGDYVEFDQPPTLENNALSLSGTAKNGVRFDENKDLSVQIYYDSSPHRLTRAQLARTYCVDSGRLVGALRWPLTGGYFWPTDEFITTYDSCPSPYDVPATAPAPNSAAEAHAAWQEAYDASLLSVPQAITVPWITATQWTASGSSFAVKANLGDVIEKNGHGVYTVSLWGKIGGENVRISQYSFFHGATAPDTYTFDE